MFRLLVLIGLSATRPFRAVTCLIRASLALMAYMWVFCHKWIRVALALIFIGGIIVIFIYAASISRNEKLKLHNALEKCLLIIFLFLASLVRQVCFPNSILKENYPDFIFLEHSVATLVFLVFYLLIVLLVVVKIVESFKGALKPAELLS